MAIYEYRCDEHGLFDLMCPLGTAPETTPCKACGAVAVRVISAPMVLGSRRSSWSALIDRAAKTRYEPDVVTSLPPAPPTPRWGQGRITPAMRNLPRP